MWDVLDRIQWCRLSLNGVARHCWVIHSNSVIQSTANHFLLSEFVVGRYGKKSLVETRLHLSGKARIMHYVGLSFINNSKQLLQSNCFHYNHSWCCKLAKKLSIFEEQDHVRLLLIRSFCGFGSKRADLYKTSYVFNCVIMSFAFIIDVFHLYWEAVSRSNSQSTEEW